MADLIVPPALREQHRSGFAPYLATAFAHVLGRRRELAALRADGTELPIELAITRVDLPGPPLFIAYGRDVSEQHRQRAELVALSDRQHQSERLDSLGRRAGGIARGFNNLLAAITNAAAFVADETAEGPAVLADVQQIQAAAERATLLTGQLLLFGRRGAHIFEPFLTTKSIGQGSGLGLATVNGIVSEARGTERAHGAHRRATSGPGLLYRSGDSEGVLSPERLHDDDATLIAKPFIRRTLLDHVGAALVR